MGRAKKILGELKKLWRELQPPNSPDFAPILSIIIKRFIKRSLNFLHQIQLKTIVTLQNIAQQDS